MNDTKKPVVQLHDVFILRNKDDAKMRKTRPVRRFQLRDGSIMQTYNAAYVMDTIIMQRLRPQGGNADPTLIPHVVLKKLRGDGPDIRTIPVSTLFMRSEVVPLSEELEVG